MTSTPGTAQLPPRPVTYPGSSAPVGHRLGAGVITAIIASVVVLAAVVTAALVLPGHHGSKPAAPPWPATASKITPPARQPVSGGSAGAVAPPETVTIAGLPITVHPDWEVVDQSGSSVVLRDKEDTAVLLLGVENLDMNEWHDITQILNAWANARSHEYTKWSNRQIIADPPEKVDSDRFQFMQVAQYSADLSTQGGTTPVQGVLMVFVNPSTGQIGEVDFLTGSFDEAVAKWPQARTMIESMVWP